MRAWVVVIAVAGCHAAPRPAAPAKAAPRIAESNAAVAEPAPHTTPSLDSPSDGDVILIEPERRRFRAPGAQDVPEKRDDLWDPCVRAFVQTREYPIRFALGDALTRATTSCDRAAQRVLFAPPQGRAYAAQSHVGIAGLLTATSARLELVIVMRGPAPLARLTILAGATKWTSPALVAVLDASAGTWAATLPYTQDTARAVHALVETPDAIVRFESTDAIEDVALPDDEKQDLHVMADVADALIP
jgi:hypothetical protein